MLQPEAAVPYSYSAQCTICWALYLQSQVLWAGSPAKNKGGRGGGGESTLVDDRDGSL